MPYPDLGECCYKSKCPNIYAAKVQSSSCSTCSRYNSCELFHLFVCSNPDCAVSELRLRRRCSCISGRISSSVTSDRNGLRGSPPPSPHPRSYPHDRSPECGPLTVLAPTRDANEVLHGRLERCDLVIAGDPGPSPCLGRFSVGDQFENCDRLVNRASAYLDGAPTTHIDHINLVALKRILKGR